MRPRIILGVLLGTFGGITSPATALPESPPLPSSFGLTQEQKQMICKSMIREDARLQIQAPWMRSGFSLLAPGLGQWYNGEDAKAWQHAGVAIGLPLATLLAVAAIGAAYYPSMSDGNAYDAAFSGSLIQKTTMGSLILNIGWHLYSAYDASINASLRLKP